MPCVLSRRDLVFIREDLNPLLPLRHALLLLLPKFRTRQLGLLLGRVDLIAHGVKLLFLFSVVTLEAGAAALALHPVVAGGGHPAVHDCPDLRIMLVWDTWGGT